MVIVSKKQWISCCGSICYCTCTIWRKWTLFVEYGDNASEMVAILEWANSAGDGEMACPFPGVQGVQAQGAAEGETSVPNVAVAVLLSQKNSHPFQKRTLLLHQPVKIGRSVAKSKADANNAIFDCKVLSRYHASLWYENGRFYLADTQSSNGTFVNNRRLSDGGKESAPYEVSSGDVVQFGVDVIENSGSITHGCIIAILKLYLPDGKEARVSPNLSSNAAPFDDLHALGRIIKEAADREHALEEKLKSLGHAVESCRDAAETSWRAQVREDHLLCRVNFLEKRLAANNHQAPRTELQQILEEKYKYEVSAKESLRKAQEERLKLMNQICSLQWSLRSSEEECYALRNNKELAQIEYQELGNKYNILEQQLKTAQKSLNCAEKRLSAEKQCFNEVISDYENQIIQLKYDNEKKLVAESGEILENEQNNSMIDNKTWDKNDFNELALSEAIRNMPDYIKAILPDAILSKVGCKSLRASSQIKELEQKLCSLKIDLEQCQLESENNGEDINDNSAHSMMETFIGDGEEVSKIESHIMEEIFKRHKLQKLENLMDKSDKSLNDSNSIYLDDTLITNKENDETIMVEPSEKVCENSNFIEKAKEHSKDKIALLLEEIKNVAELIEKTREENPVEKMIFLQEQLSNAQTKISTLKEEQKVLHTKLIQAKDKIVAMTVEKEVMCSNSLQWENELAEKTEKCKNLELRLAHWVERENSDGYEISKYVDLATDLKKQLSAALESEANSCREINHLNKKICDYQLQLESRPSVSEMEFLKSHVETLESQLNSKEKQADELQKQVSILTDIQINLEEKITRLIAQHNENTETSRVISKCETDANNLQNTPLKNESSEEVVISSSLSAADIMWNHDHGKFIGSDGAHCSSISVDLKRLSELEEELIMTKEKWAHISEERLQLTQELKNMTDKYNSVANRSSVNILIFVVPVIAILLYILLMQQSHQSIS